MTKEDVINKLEEKKQEYLSLQEKAFDKKDQEYLDFCSGMANAFDLSLVLVKSIE